MTHFVESNVEAIENLAKATGKGLFDIADAIFDVSALAGTDATGGHVNSLVEAVMGVTAGLVRIAEALNNIADAMRERG